jgi:hypothetical protein
MILYRICLFVSIRNPRWRATGGHRLNIELYMKMNFFFPQTQILEIDWIETVNTELAKTFFFCLTLVGSDRNWGSVWPMAFVSVPPFFCNIVYNLSNFAFYTELNARLPIIMIIKQLLDARVINFIQQTLASSVTHATIDRLLRKIANHKIMIVEPKLKRTLFRSHFYNKLNNISKQNALV